MSDENRALYSPGNPETGQSQEQPSPPAEQPEEDRTPEYITKKDLETFKDDISRLIQSRSDKTENRLQKAIDVKLKKLDQLTQGMQIDPQTLEKARERIREGAILDEVMRDVEDGQGAQPVRQGKPDDLVRYANERARKIQEEAGVFLEPDDPEFKTLKTDTPDPFEFLESLKAAVEKKKARGVNPESRIPGLVSGGTAKEDWRAAYEREVREALKDPINGRETALQIRRKYRKEGHPI